MSELLVRARDMLKQQKAELDKLEVMIRQYEEARQYLSEVLGDESVPDQVVVVPVSDMIEKVEQILTASDRPMSGSEIMQSLSKLGVELGGKDPLNNLSTRLSREAARPGSRIKSNGRGQGYYIDAEMTDHQKFLADLLGSPSSKADDSPI